MLAKKKIGFIDLFIDEWHANNYPKWFREAKRSNEFELGYAWEESTMEGRRNLQQWCAEMGMTPACSMEEVVEKSDCICVLAPANPEVHERLAALALKSGKPVYIDKPFAESLATAERIFETAEKYNTPLMSSSALRFSDELLSGKVQNMKPIMFTTTGGGRSFDEYGIHQLEMIVSVMGTDVKNITFTGNEKRLSFSYEFANGNMAQIAYSPFMPFTITAASESESVCFSAASHIFENLIDAMLDFFADGKSRVPKAETLCISALLEKSTALLHGK
ncbi:MAG: Gfo/Idh/MocA family oxidoreductase [Lentisphaeria bacterium]|nr:Gfo/Idh/MocA family oxidoreductase [Lentisphaeria bacterium]